MKPDCVKVLSLMKSSVKASSGLLITVLTWPLLPKPTCPDFAKALGVREARLHESPQLDTGVSLSFQWGFLITVLTLPLLPKPTCPDFAGVLGVREARLRESPQLDVVVGLGLQRPVAERYCPALFHRMQPQLEHYGVLAAHSAAGAAGWFAA